MRIGAKLPSPSIAGAEEELPRLVIDSAARTDTPRAVRRKTFQEVMIEKGNKAVLQSDLAKAAKISSKKKRKRDFAPLWKQVML